MRLFTSYSLYLTYSILIINDAILLMNKLPTITLTRKFHRKEQRILVGFMYSKNLIAIIRNISSARWSATLKSWHVESSENAHKNLARAFKGHAFIDVKQLKPQPHVALTNTSLKRHRQLTDEQRFLLNNFVKYLKGKRYSESTILTYSRLIADFIEYAPDKPITEVNNKDVDGFTQDILAAKQYAISTQRQFISALKIFKKYCPECHIDDAKLERPKKSRTLPSVLSQREIIELLQHTKNLKHRAILALIYSAGLRISELLNLELKHISIDRKQLFIKNSKGRKDRYAILSNSFIPLLKNYYMTYKPDVFFVESPKGGKYSATSIRSFLKTSCRNMGLTKTVTPHTLRHSYATHLMENGVGLRYIQELLGHARPETTMIYTHVAKKDLTQIESPLDTAFKQLSKTDNNDILSLISRN